MLYNFLLIGCNKSHDMPLMYPRVHWRCSTNTAMDMNTFISHKKRIQLIHTHKKPLKGKYVKQRVEPN